MAVTLAEFRPVLAPRSQSTCSASRPFFGVDPVVLRDDSTPCSINEGGKLCIRRPWPGMMRTVYGDHARFQSTYFEMFKGLYFTGDGCRRDEDGYYWITGRVDDVINVSGHRIGTAEVESALVANPLVAESGEEYTDALKKELVNHVRNEIGPIAAPDQIHWAPGLPKTRSGKIMRRILRKIAEHDLGTIGDTSTLADPSVVEDLIKNDPRNK